MAKLTRQVRDLKTVRETELIVSRRFRRELSNLDFDSLRADLREMFKDGTSRGAYSVFYFSFTFNVKDVDTDELSPDLQRYIMESLKQRFKGRFDNIESAPEADVYNWRVFTSAYKARRSELETFLATLEALFDREVKAKFNVEIDHTIFLVGASAVFKKSRREKAARKGLKKKRKRSRVRLVVYKLKAAKKTRKRQRLKSKPAKKRKAAKRVKKTRQRPKSKPAKNKKAAKRVKRSRKVTSKARKRSKKSRRI